MTPLWLFLLLSIPILFLSMTLSGCSGRESGSAASVETSGETTETARAETAGDETAGETSLETAKAELEILAFSAGKADAFLLTTPNSTVVLDCGEKGFGRTILAELEQRGISSIDYLIISHFDQDHVGGAARILNNIPVNTVLQNSLSKDSEEYEKYVKALKNASLEAVTVRETLSFTLDGVRYTVDPPRKNKYQDDTSNNASLIVTVENGEDRFLFLGDALSERLEEFLEWNTARYDVLKVPHHGKEEPLTEALLKETAPRYALITSSEEEPEDASTVALLEAAGAAVYLTRTAPVVITSGEAGLSVAYGSNETS